MRVRFKQDFSLSSDSTERRDLGSVGLDLTSDSLGEGGTQRTHVPAGAVDLQLQYPQVANAALVHIVVEARDKTQVLGELRLKKNGVGGEYWALLPLPGTKRSVFLATTQGITALYVSNPGTVAVDVTVSVAGD